MCLWPAQGAASTGEGAASLQVQKGLHISKRGVSRLVASADSAEEHVFLASQATHPFDSMRSLGLDLDFVLSCQASVANVQAWRARQMQGLQQLSDRAIPLTQFLAHRVQDTVWPVIQNVHT
eukprot:1186423-Karenia_brevis.AAC.1